MTVLSDYRIEVRGTSDVLKTIRNNDPIDDVLHVIAVVSNPCNFKRRYQLAKDFIERMECEPDVELHTVELVYGNQEFVLGADLELRTDSAPIWIKENLINVAVKKLLPENWKAMAWIDADLEFENPTWALDTLKILNGAKDIVQLFSHALDLDKDGSAMKVFAGIGYKPKEGSHPGYAWACTRRCYNKMGGLYDVSILGAGDHNMAMALLGQKSLNKDVSQGYTKSVQELIKRCRNLRLGYVPGVIHHFYHGQKSKRGYGTRWKILVKYQYDPFRHIHRDVENGFISCHEPKEMLDDIMDYFKSRDEDE
jgi:hypothetical protein